ncbi:MAG: response regulator [Deltaproteobacteria bacterium]|nr:response regulator [Deltaproteobacteria bacterium]
MVPGKAETTQILFVDDDERALRAFQRGFESAEYRVTVTTDVLGALELAEQDKFQIIICDYIMPAMDGVAFLERCRRIAPDSLRILISGDCDYQSSIDAINRGGVYKLVTKPWDVDELKAMLREAAEQYWTKKESERLSKLIKEQNTELVVRTLNLDREIHERTSSLLNGLVTALDLRDTETQWHSRRVSLYSKRIAKALGIRGEEIRSIERGALLHDIGKIGIRDSILLKPGRLTAEEWVEMRKHPDMGYKLLEGSDFLERERIIVLHHQERYDGKGYPLALKAKDIDIGARIFAIADTFDAMTSDRPYRQALTFKAAREEIIRCSGTQFDPRVVDAFLSIPHMEWREIREKVEGRDLKGEKAMAHGAPPPIPPKPPSLGPHPAGPSEPIRPASLGAAAAGSPGTVPAPVVPDVAAGAAPPPPETGSPPSGESSA